jgi:hypothetical protein
MEEYGAGIVCATFLNCPHNILPRPLMVERRE